MSATSAKSVMAAFGASALLLAGCSDDEVCGEDCSAGVTCTTTYEVPSDYSLSEAAGEAGAGSCILVAPGSYEAVTLAGGVSLLGPGAGSTQIGTVTVQPGNAATVRKVHVAGVVKVRPNATNVTLDQLLVTGSKNGVQAESGASFTLSNSELRGVPENAVLVVDAERATIRNTTIVGSAGPGLWAQCSGGCDCATQPRIELEDVRLEGNAFIGASLIGVNAEFNNVEIKDTVKGDVMFGTAGGGVAVSQCSAFSALDTTIDGAEGYGLLVDSSAANLGGTSDGEARGIIIVNNREGGVWLKNITDSYGVRIENGDIRDNGVVGLGIDSGSRGIIIVNNRIASTTLESVPAAAWVEKTPNSGEFTLTSVGEDSIGDGMVWGEGADVSVDGLTLSSNARHALLIDGDVSGSLRNVSLEGGDEALGIVQQRSSVGPSVEGSTPMISSELEVTAFDALPVSPQAPGAL